MNAKKKSSNESAQVHDTQSQEKSNTKTQVNHKESLSKSQLKNVKGGNGPQAALFGVRGRS
jgi:hypothetical protein